MMVSKTNFVLLSSLVLFAGFAGYLVFKEARRDNYSLERSDVIEFFTSKINEISPDKPVLGGKWLVTRFRFVDKNNVYVEYEDGHIARAFLLTVTKSVGAAPDYRIVGYFEPGPLGYKILAGEDALKDRPQEIYEYNETTKRWIRVN